MKFLDCPQLQSLFTELLHGITLFDKRVFAKVEVYSCRRAGSDKKLSKELERQYVHELDASPAMAVSPLGLMTDSAVRRLLINLISTMNASFPDYDFRTVRPEQFTVEPNHDLVYSQINSHLCSIMEQIYPGFVDKLWFAMREVIDPSQCMIYSYLPDLDADPLSHGKLWSFNYFFFNKKMKKIAFFAASMVSKPVDEYDSEDEEEADMGNSAPFELQMDMEPFPIDS